LFILRKHELVNAAPVKKNKDEEGRPLFDDFRKPLRYKENDLGKDMVDNFHWVLLEKRRGKGLSRKQVASALGENENSVKLMENGVIPFGNYVLVSKLEKFYGVNLRKYGNYQVSARKVAEEKAKEDMNNIKREVEGKDDVTGDDVDLLLD